MHENELSEKYIQHVRDKASQGNNSIDPYDVHVLIKEIERLKALNLSEGMSLSEMDDRITNSLEALNTENKNLQQSLANQHSHIANIEEELAALIEANRWNDPNEKQPNIILPGDSSDMVHVKMQIPNKTIKLGTAIYCRAGYFLVLEKHSNWRVTTYDKWKILGWREIQEQD